MAAIYVYFQLRPGTNGALGQGKKVSQILKFIPFENAKAKKPQNPRHFKITAGQRLKD